MKKIPFHHEQMTKCPFCSSTFAQEDFVHVQEDDTKTIAHATCSRCRSSLLLISNVGQFGIMNIGVPTDLSSGEAGRLLRSKKISSDQVLEVHSFLKRYKGGSKGIAQHL